MMNYSNLFSKFDIQIQASHIFCVDLRVLIEPATYHFFFKQNYV